MLILSAYKSKANFENVATVIKKENLPLTHYSHVFSALKEVKHVARILAHISIAKSWKMKQEN